MIAGQFAATVVLLGGFAAGCGSTTKKSSNAYPNDEGTGACVSSWNKRASADFQSTLASSASPFDDFTCVSPDPQHPQPVCRWGDYSGASPDPLNSDVVWGTSEYSGGGGWLTRNFAVEALPGGPSWEVTWWSGSWHSTVAGSPSDWP